MEFKEDDNEDILLFQIKDMLNELETSTRRLEKTFIELIRRVNKLKIRIDRLEKRLNMNEKIT